MKLESILSKKQENLLKDERQWLLELQAILNKFGASEEDQITLAKSIQQLDELFLLVIVGEFNAGKSAFINALLGQKLLKEGVTPTTAQVNVLKYGDASARDVAEAHLHVMKEPIDLLRHINIVDTPGTNAIVREHQAITEEFVPRSDLVLFITSADRPFTESERGFLSQIKDWGKKVVMVINKIDLFQTEEDLNQVIEFVRENATKLLNVTPDIFPVSGRSALQSKLGEAETWDESRFEALEKYIYDSLDQTSRLRLKFLNPLGVADRLVTNYTEVTDEHLTLLEEDFETIDNLERQLTLYREDMHRDFKFRLSDIENILFSMEKRGNTYFDETMRLLNMGDLLNRSRLRQGFENKVVANASQEIEQKINEMIDWLVNSDLSQWQAVTNYLEQRKQEYEDRMVGDVGGNFHYDRNRLIDSVGKSAQHVVETYDKSDEARKMAEQAQLAVAGTAAIGALGVGTIVTALAVAAVSDVTGVIAGSALTALGLFVIPARKRTAKKEMADSLAALRVQLTDSLTTQFEKELNRSLQRINDAIAPYTRFVRSEKDRLTETKEALTEAHRKQSQFRAQVEEIL